MNAFFAKFAFLIFGICLLINVEAQVITAGPDSTLVKTPLTLNEKPILDSSALILKRWSKPGKAALYSAIIPGGGQFYNKSYWKIPLVYAMAGGVGYFLVTNHKQFIHLRQAVRVRTDGIKDNENDRYAERFGSLNLDPNSIDNLKRNRDNFRRYRDYNILFSILAYGINITEAYVYAHLKDFDISDELSLQIQPGLLPTALATKYTPGLSLSFNLKK